MIKETNGKGNNELRDTWETPKWLFDILNKQYNFKFDCCASETNTKCGDYATNFTMWHPIEKTSWMNPPFSKSFEMFKHFFNSVQNGVAIYRCDNMETKIWQDIILKNADWVFIPKGRIAYEGMEGKGSRFPSALIGKGVEPIKEIEGVILYLK